MSTPGKKKRVDVGNEEKKTVGAKAREYKNFKHRERRSLLKQLSDKYKENRKGLRLGILLQIQDNAVGGGT